MRKKTNGKIQAHSVASISLADIRSGGHRRVHEKLKTLVHNSVCVVNAVSMRDLEIFTQGLLDAEAEGHRFLYRTAASFVPARAGLESRPLLTGAELRLPVGGGLIVVGSYVGKSTEQVSRLLEEKDLLEVEVDVSALLESKQREVEIARARDAINENTRSGNDTIILTSRRFVTGESAEHQLIIGQSVSSALVAVVEALSVRPRYLIAKGGITASDIATKALGEERAMVLGQIAPGVPVWRLGEKSRFPGLVYVVFPGNVGTSQTLLEIVSVLKEGR